MKKLFFIPFIIITLSCYAQHDSTDFYAGYNAYHQRYVNALGNNFKLAAQLMPQLVKLANYMELYRGYTCAGQTDEAIVVRDAILAILASTYTPDTIPVCATSGSGGGSTNASGENNYVQFNIGDLFSSDANFQYDPSSDSLSVGNWLDVAQAIIDTLHIESTIKVYESGGFMYVDAPIMGVQYVLKEYSDNNNPLYTAVADTGTGIAIKDDTLYLIVDHVNELYITNDTIYSSNPIKTTLVKLGNYGSIESESDTVTIKVGTAEIKIDEDAEIKGIESITFIGDATKITSFSNDTSSTATTTALSGRAVRSMIDAYGGAGGVDASGTPVNTYVPFFTDVNTLSSSANFRWNGTNIQLARTYGIKFTIGSSDWRIYQSNATDLDFTFEDLLYYTVSTSGIRGGTNNGDFMLNHTTSTATVPGFTFYGDQNTGVGRAAADQLSLISGGDETMRIYKDSALVNGDLRVTGTLTAANLSGIIETEGTPTNKQNAVWRDDNTIGGTDTLFTDGGDMYVAGDNGAVYIGDVANANKLLIQTEANAVHAITGNHSTGFSLFENYMWVMIDATNPFTFHKDSAAFRKPIRVHDGIYFADYASSDTLVPLIVNGSLDTASLYPAGWALVKPIPSLKEHMTNIKDGELVWPRMEQGKINWTYRKINPFSAYQQFQAAHEMTWRWMLKEQEEKEELKSEIEELKQEIEDLKINYQLQQRLIYELMKK